MAEVLRIGTLVPKASPWGVMFEVWAKSVKAKTGGALELQLFYGGSQGDEAALIGKLKAGQLEGAAVSCAGLGRLYRPILAFQLPGLFTTWGQVDAAREAMRAEFEAGVTAAGARLVGWYDIGMTMPLSRGHALRGPGDLARNGKRPWQWRDDALHPLMYAQIGVRGVPLNLPEVPAHLEARAIDALWQGPLLAEHLLWTSRLDALTEQIVSATIGAVVLSGSRLSALAPELRGVVSDTGRIVCAALVSRIRTEEAAALGRLKKEMTVVSPSADERQQWAALFGQVRRKAAEDTFSPELVARLEAMA